MSDEETLDVIVVGAGLAGLACAWHAAKAGLSTAVLERGDVAGGKNLSGGRLYLEPVQSLCGELLLDAPFERPVVSESIVLLGADDGLSIRSDTTRQEDRPHSVTVLRAKLDQHLADRVGELGAMVLPQQRVEALLREGDRIVGVKVGSEELRARLVVVADGVLSFLAEEAGLRANRPVVNYGLGVKEIIQLDAQSIEQRFNLAAGQGASRLFIGDLTEGLPGGGFIYTNRDSLSLGLVMPLEALAASNTETQISDLVERFKQRPEVAPLIAGGKTIEYGAHLVPEGGFAALPSLGVPGLLLAGDAAGLVINSGITLRGMDLALASGALAGQVAAAALPADLSAEEILSRYQQAIKDSFVWQQMKAFRKAPRLLANERIYGRYPQRVAQWTQDLFRVQANGQGTSLRKASKRLRREVLGWRGLRDLWRLSRM